MNDIITANQRAQQRQRKGVCCGALTALACLALKRWQYSWASGLPGLWETKANWASQGRAVVRDTLRRAWAMRRV